MRITKSQLKKFILNELDENMQRNAGDLYTDPTAGQYQFEESSLNKPKPISREAQKLFTILIGDELETARPLNYQDQKGLVNTAKQLLKQGERVWIKSNGGMLSDESNTWEIKLDGDKVVWEEVNSVNESRKITRSMIRGLIKEVFKENNYMDIPAYSRQTGQEGYPGDAGNPNSINDRIDGFVDINLVSYLISNMRELEDEYGITRDQFIAWIKTKI